jgi:hypothetical protein
VDLNLKLVRQTGKLSVRIRIFREDVDEMTSNELCAETVSSQVRVGGYLSKSYSQNKLKVEKMNRLLLQGTHVEHIRKYGAASCPVPESASHVNIISYKTANFTHSLAGGADLQNR